MANGKAIIAMVMEYKYGKKETNMRGTGPIICSTERAYFIIQTVTNMMATGFTIWHMVLAYLHSKMEIAMKENGKMTTDMEKVRKSEMTEQSILVILWMDSKKEKAITSEVMLLFIMVNGKKTKLQGLALSIGQMDVAMKGIG